MLSPCVEPVADGFWAENLDGQSEAVNWIWEGYLSPGTVTMLTSQWKSGKTTLLSILLRRLQDGGMLAGLPVQPARAIVVSEESAELWAQRHARLHFRGHYFFCRPFRAKPTLEQWRQFLERIAVLERDHGMKLVVFDTLATFLPGRNEASAGVMMEALLPLQELTKKGMSLLLMHHPRKGEVLAGQAARGSGALAAFVDIVLEMAWCAHPGEDDRRRRILAFSRFEQTPRQRVIELNPEATDYLVHGTFHDDDFMQSWDRVKLILENAAGKRTRGQLLEDWPEDFAKPTDMTMSRWLARAVALGLVLREGNGRRNDPFRYWLRDQEDKWKQNPLYEINRLFEESRRQVDAALGKS